MATDKAAARGERGKKKSGGAPREVPEPVLPERKTAFTVVASSPEDVYPATARTMVRPSLTAAAVISAYETDTHDADALAAELEAQVAAVNAGDMRRAEAMLIAQAHTLDQLFSHLARRATKQQLLPQWEAYMRAAFKAQNQCRMTLETLGALKNPPVVYARQANVTTGPQQINNGAAHAPELPSRRNELLANDHGEQLDFGETSATGRADSDLVPVGSIDRAEDCGGQVQSLTQRGQGPAAGARAVAQSATAAPRAKALARGDRVK